MNTKYQWHICTKTNEERIPSFFQKEGIPPSVAKIMMHRGINTGEDLFHFLHDDLSMLADPFLMKDMRPAVERILSAVDRKEKIVIYGDYDVDGITSTSILCRYLHRIGADVDFYIPAREGEGYGLNKMALDTLAASGFTLLITVDCGISSADLIAQKPDSLDVIVTDHHMPPEVTPSCVATINPHQEDCPYPYKELAGCGVAYMVCRALQRERFDSEYTEDVELVALGTIADVVSLTGENRILVREGLSRFSTTKVQGLYSLLKASGIVSEKMDREIRADRISFGIAPRLNAAGRIAHAGEGVRLMLSESPDEADILAEQLCDRNTERQRIEKMVYQQALARMEELKQKQDMALIIDGEDWNPGVIGIVASRIMERQRRPTFLLTIKDGIGKGSCRSISAFNIYEALKAQSDLLLQFGGHKMAAGFSIKEENIPALRKRLNEYARKTLTEDDCVPILDVEDVLQAEEITVDMIRSLSLLEPCGCDNPKPIFAMKDAFVESTRRMGNTGQHFKCVLSQKHKSVEALFWNIGEESPCKAGETVSIVFDPEVHEWYGEHPQLICKDIRKTDKIVLTRAFLVQLFKDIKNILLISEKPVEEVIRMLLRKGLSAEKISLGLSVFEELGILSRSPRQGKEHYVYHVLREKTDLSVSKIYKDHQT